MKTEKKTITIEFCVFKLVLVQNFSLDWQFDFRIKLGQPRRICPIKNGKREHHHWILHIRISRGTKFQLKVGLSSFKKIALLASLKALNKKWFLFHLKSFFRSQDIYVFVMTFWSSRKNGLIRKISLVSKFMTLLLG